MALDLHLPRRLAKAGPAPLAVILALCLALLSGCATTTTVGVTTNEAPKLQELGR